MKVYLSLCGILKVFNIYWYLLLYNISLKKEKIVPTKILIPLFYGEKDLAFLSFPKKYTRFFLGFKLSG